jgi:hypothetical protein
LGEPVRKLHRAGSSQQKPLNLLYLYFVVTKMKPVEQIVKEVSEILNSHMETKITVEANQTEYWKGKRKGMKLTGVTFKANRAIGGIKLLALLQYAADNNFAIEVCGETFDVFNNLPFGSNLE